MKQKRNVMVRNSLSILIFLFSISLVSAQVSITEIYYDTPSPELPNEFIELYVPFNSSVSLENYIISTLDDDETFLPAITHGVNGYYVVLYSGSGISDTDATDGNAFIYLGKANAILANGGDEVALFDDTGIIVDFVRYEGGNGDPVMANWPNSDQGTEQTSDAHSIQLQGADNDDSSNWVREIPSPGTGNAPLINVFANINSTIENSDIINSDVQHSTVKDSVIIDSLITHSTLINVLVKNSHVDNQTLSDVTIDNNIIIPDRDHDGIADNQDNCPDRDNPFQEDSDQDGIGDVCDRVRNTVCDGSTSSSVSGGSGVSLGITLCPEDFEPLIWMCDSRSVLDDSVEEGRTQFFERNRVGDHNVLYERSQNYAFEGEQIEWLVLVMDKNKVEQIQDVVATIGPAQGRGNDIEVECAETSGPEKIPETCNARILEEKLYDFDSETMDYYSCVFTVETPNSMYGEYFLTTEVISVDGEATMDENEYWFFNPIIGITVDGTIQFDNIRPGTSAYSETVLVGNDADDGSGVLLDMFITGTDFYDPSSSGAKCPVSNELNLEHIRYYTAFGAYSSHDDLEVDDGHLANVRNVDAEGYLNIQYGDNFERALYDEAEIIQGPKIGPYYTANILAPGAEMALTFRLDLPEPCIGDFSDGQIYFWGEAI